MKKIDEYLNDLKRIYGSDYAIAKHLGLTKQSISTMRKGGNIKDETAIKIADELGIDRGEVLLSAVIERSNGTVLEAWKNVSKRAGIAAGIVGLLLSNGMINAYTLTLDVIPEGSMYIMSNYVGKNFNWHPDCIIMVSIITESK